MHGSDPTPPEEGVWKVVPDRLLPAGVAVAYFNDAAFMEEHADEFLDRRPRRARGRGKGKGKGRGGSEVENDSDENFEVMATMLGEFRATGAHYSEDLREQFPLFEGPAPPGHPYPEAFGARKGRGQGFVSFGA